MNRYFYIPVTSQNVCHDGVSFQDHLRVVDFELYEREKEYHDSISSLSFEDGKLSPRKLDKITRFNQALEVLYKDRLLVRYLIIVLNESGMYELASEEEIDPIDIEKIQAFEITGEDVVNVFVKNLDYPPFAMNFFESYRKNKKHLNSETPKSTGKKVFQKFLFFLKKNS